MPSCIVPGCKSRNRSNPEKVHFFTVPSNSLREIEWKKAIRGREVKQRDSVCEKHFHRSEILWEKHILGPDGKILGVGRYKIPRLKVGSVPSIFPWTESVAPTCSPSVTPKADEQGDPEPKLNKELNTRPELGIPEALHQEQQIVQTANSENPENGTNNGKIVCQVAPSKGGSLPSQFPSTKTEKQGDAAPKLKKEQNAPELGIPKALQPEQLTLLTTDKSVAVGCVKFANLENGTINSKTHCQEKESNPSGKQAPTELCFLDIVNEEVNLPQGWVKLVTGCKGKKLVIFYVNETVEVDQSYNMFPLKNVVVKEDLSMNIKVVGFLFNDQESLSSQSFSTITELQDIILKLHRLSVCCGVVSSSECKMYQTNDTLHEDISLRWRHKNCSLLGVNQKVCTRCKTTKTSLQRKLRASLRKTKRIDDKESRKALQAKYRRAFRMQQLNATKMKSIQAENVRLRSQLEQKKSQNLDELLNNKNIPQNYVLVIREMMEAAKHKDVKGRQYSEEWRLVCLLLHTQSPSSYQFLRSNNYLPLPSLRTVQRWIREKSQESGNILSSCAEETERTLDLIKP